MWNGCEIGDEINLDNLTNEMLRWFELICTNCQPNKSWWDVKNNRPEIGGLFAKIELDDDKWILENSGVYDYGKPYFVKSPKKYMFKFKGVDWNEETLKVEISKQYKEFLVKTKLNDIEKDFE